MDKIIKNPRRNQPTEAISYQPEWVRLQKVPVTLKDGDSREPLAFKSTDFALYGQNNNPHFIGQTSGQNWIEASHNNVNKDILDEEVPIPPELLKKSKPSEPVQLEENHSELQLVPGWYGLYIQNHLMKISESLQEMEKFIEMILLSDEFEISLEEIKLVHCLKLKYGVSVSDD